MIFIAIEKLHKIQPEQTKIGFYNKKIINDDKNGLFSPSHYSFQSDYYQPE